MRGSDALRYGLWLAVAATARRNRKEYGVPTAWLTHLAGNTLTLMLPDILEIVRRLDVTPPSIVQPLLRTLHRRVCDDPAYAAYVAPLALGFVASHPDYSIYHGQWAERTLLGFGLDSVPHSSAAYALARLTGKTLVTLHHEVPHDHALARPVAVAARHADAIAAAVVIGVTLVWEVSEYLAHQAEVERTGRDPSEVNMQWGWLDAITDSLSNVGGLLAAIAVRRANAESDLALENPILSAITLPDPPSPATFDTLARGRPAYSAR